MRITKYFKDLFAAPSSEVIALKELEAAKHGGSVRQFATHSSRTRNAKGIAHHQQNESWRCCDVRVHSAKRHQGYLDHE